MPLLNHTFLSSIVQHWVSVSSYPSQVGDMDLDPQKSITGAKSKLGNAPRLVAATLVLCRFQLNAAQRINMRHGVNSVASRQIPSKLKW